MESKSPDDTLRMCRMTYICLLCTCSKVLFHLTCPIILTLVQLVLALLPNAELQAKELLVQIMISLRHDPAGDRTHNLQIRSQTSYQPNHLDWLLPGSTSMFDLFFQLEFYGPVNTVMVMLSRSINLLFLGRLSPLEGLTSTCA